MADVAPILGYLFVMSITPGPNNLMLTASGVNFGFTRTIPHMLGIIVGLSVQTYLTALGLGVLFTEVPVVREGLKFVGVAYLLWMSWKIVGAQVANASEGARPLRSYEATGFQFVNPKAWIMTSTLSTLFLPTQLTPALGGLYLVAILVLVHLPCISVWALFGNGLKRGLVEERPRRIFNLVMCVLLLATAVAIVWQ